MMKLMLVLSTIVLTAFTCRKSGIRVDEKDIMGKWNLVEEWMHTGGGEVFNPVESKASYVEFKSDGSFSSNMDSYSVFSSYEKAGGNKFRLLTSNGNSSVNVIVELNAKGLKTFRDNCIEGCGDIFTR